MEIKVDSNEIWEQIEEELSFYSPAKLKIGEDEITIAMKLSENKVIYVIYINGWMKGAETQENQEKYWNLRRLRTPKIHLEYHRKMARNSKDKEEKKKHRELSKQTYCREYYDWLFTSFRTLKSTYKRRHKEIYWLKEA